MNRAWMGAALLLAFLCGQNDSNLVLNGSFEKITKKIKTGDEIKYVEGWESEGTVNIFVRDAKVNEFKVPDNSMGSEEPYSGDAYAGFVAYAERGAMERGFLIYKLKEPLKPGNEYCVSAMVSLAEISGFAVNGIGIAVLGYRPLLTQLKGNIKPDVVREGNPPLTTHEGWVQICDKVKPSQESWYVVIGNFMPDASVKKVKMRRPRGSKVPQKPIAYYFVDEVSIKNKPCECLREVSQTHQNEDYLGMKTVYRRSIAYSEKKDVKDEIENTVIYFRENSSKVDISEEVKIKNIAEILKNNPNVNIKVVGYACGDEDKGLGDARSQSVENILKIEGVPSSRITREGQYIEGLSPQELPKNRKVVFVVGE